MVLHPHLNRGQRAELAAVQVAQEGDVQLAHDPEDVAATRVGEESRRAKQVELRRMSRRRVDSGKADLFR